MCSLCRIQLESHDHLFFERPFLSAILKSIVEKNLVTGKMALVIDWFLLNSRGRSLRNTCLNTSFAAAVYAIWMERNKTIKGSSTDLAQVSHAVLSSIRLMTTSQENVSLCRSSGISQHFKCFSLNSEFVQLSIGFPGFLVLLWLLVLVLA